MALTLDQIISGKDATGKDIRWSSLDFVNSEPVNEVLKNGLIARQGAYSQQIMAGLNVELVPPTVQLGFINHAWAEPNIGNSSTTNAVPTENEYFMENAKPLLWNNWRRVALIESDLIASRKPIEMVHKVVSEHFAESLNKFSCAIIDGLKDVTEITIGDGTTEFSESMVREARAIKGDKGVGNAQTMTMSSVTLNDIMSKNPQQAGLERLISITDGVAIFRGGSVITVDDNMASGIIALADVGAIAYADKNILDPLMYSDQPLTGNGNGARLWGNKSLIVLHPVGFDFIGVQGTTHAELNGVSIAEFTAGGQYKLRVDPKESKILILNVLVG